jgi:hypothetical protein
LGRNGAISLDATVVVSPEQISCNLKDEAVILSLSGGVYYGLNSVGSRIWELVQTPRLVREIRDILLAEYDVNDELCTAELIELLEQLSYWKLLRLENGSNQA